MTQAQRRSAANPSARPKRRRKIEFIASVRFLCGDTELFSVSNARTVDEARAMVLDEISDVATVLIAERCWPH